MSLTLPPTFEAWPTLTGRQEPHNVSISTAPFEDFHGAKAVNLAKRARTPLMPWQSWSLSNMLLTAPGCPDGPWTHSESCLLVPRQNGKSLILTFRILYGLFVLNENIIFTAQRWKTARSIAQRTIAVINGSPSLKAKLAKSPTMSQGEGHVLLKSGAQAFFSTRSGDMGRGLDDVDLVIYDEAYNLTASETGALDWTQMAATRPQTIYTSSAVDEEKHPFGEVLASVRRRGLAGRPRLFLAEYMAPEHMDRAAIETAQYANPSYGVIQDDEKIIGFQEKKLSTEVGRREYDVEALGRGFWPVEAEMAKFTVIPEEKWFEMVDDSPDLTGPIALGLDRSIDRKWWVIAAAQRTSDGRIHVEIGYFQSGSHAEIVDILVDLITLWDPCVLVTDANSPAAVIEPQLLDEQIELVKTTATQMVTACGGFYDDAVETPILSHTNQPALTDAVEGAAQRFLPKGDWAWDKQADVVLAPLVAATLARWGLVTYGSRQKKTMAARPSIVTESTDYADEFDALEAAF